MTYRYICSACSSDWEANLNIDFRNFPCDEPCPKCLAAAGAVSRRIDSPSISYNGSKTILQRAGSGWNDVLNKVKKASGRHTTIETR